MNVGIEIEFTGISRIDVCNLLKENLGMAYKFESFLVSKDSFINFGRFNIKDKNGNTWYLVVDRSIKQVLPEKDVNRGIAETEYMCELVSPVLDSRNLDLLYEIMSIIRLNGGVTNETCGIHIHIDKPCGYKLYNAIVNVMKNGDTILNVLGIPKYRVDKYCKVFPKEVIDDFMSEETRSKIRYKKFNTNYILDYFYDKLGERGKLHKNPLRYYMLNLDSLKVRNTLEFRMFNSTLSPRVLSSYINWLYDFLM